jgi:ABC-type phosphate/phosphonate transport system substrate-binding protein
VNEHDGPGGNEITENIMQRLLTLPVGLRRATVAAACVVVLTVQASLCLAQEAGKIDVLHIGTSGSLAFNPSQNDEQAALDTLKNFIKTETGFDNDITASKDWPEVAAKLAAGKLQLGVLQGYEFAWAKEKYPKLKPLAIAVDATSYRYAYVMVKRDSPITDFAGLQHQVLSLPHIGKGHLTLFVEGLCTAAGKRLVAFFSRIATPDNTEDALDDVVDGVVQAAVVDRVGLDAYKRRKPGRFARLKEIAHSGPFPAPVVAYYDDNVAQATLDRFKKGLLDARRKERGEKLLNFFKLRSFEAVPANYEKVLVETRQKYPSTTQATGSTPAPRAPRGQ